MNIAVDPQNKFKSLESVNQKLKKLEVLSFEKMAAEGLLPLHNESWNENDKDLTKEEFIKAITLKSITLELEGDSSIWFDDGDLFYGHSIHISLDKSNEVQDVGIMG